MIVSPRAKKVFTIVRLAPGRIIEIDKVFLRWREGYNPPTSGGNRPGCNCKCEHKPCVMIAEADYDTENFTFDHTVRILNGEGNPTGGTIHLDTIIEMEAKNE